MFSLLAPLGSARAQSKESLAEGLFRTAREEMKTGDFEAACPKLAESYRLEPASGTLLNLAVCDERRGRRASAWTEYHRFVETAGPGDSRIEFATARIRVLESHLARVRLRAVGAPPGSALSLDGVALGLASVDVDMPVDAGEHVAVLVAPDDRRTERRFSVGQDELAKVDLTLPAVAAAPAASVTSTAHAREKSPAAHADTHAHDRAPSNTGLWTAGYVAAGVGVLGFASALTFTILASDEKSTVIAHCPGKVCDDTGLHAADRGSAYLRAADVGLVVGTLGVLTGGYFFYRAWTVKPSVTVGSRTAFASVEGEF